MMVHWSMHTFVSNSLKMKSGYNQYQWYQGIEYKWEFTSLCPNDFSHQLQRFCYHICRWIWVLAFMKSNWQKDASAYKFRGISDIRNSGE